MISLYIKICVFILFSDNYDITFVTYMKSDLMKRFKDILFFIEEIPNFFFILVLSKKNTNVNTEKFSDHRKQSNIGISYTAFPLGNRLRSYAKLFSQYGLCPTAFFS